MSVKHLLPRRVPGLPGEKKTLDRSPHTGVSSPDPSGFPSGRLTVIENQ